MLISAVWFRVQAQSCPHCRETAAVLVDVERRGVPDPPEVDELEFPPLCLLDFWRHPVLRTLGCRF